LNQKCPRCREGNLFPYKTYNLGKFGIMHESCPRCDQDFRIEPGFYFGASYIGYGFNVALTLIFITVYFTLLDHWSEWVLVGVVVGVSILMIPLNFRYSRTLMMHFFSGARYEPGSADRDAMYVGPDGTLHSQEATE
ncbi:MAG: DUF983 domain-containing protein, partial [Bacteroidota bacterium]